MVIFNSYVELPEGNIAQKIDYGLVDENPRTTIDAGHRHGVSEVPSASPVLGKLRELLHLDQAR